MNILEDRRSARLRVGLFGIGLDAYWPQFGQDGPGHISVEMAVKHGPVTLLSVIEHGGKLALLFAEAESVSGPILEIGNTNSRYRFACGAREFVNRWNSHGPAHHCAVGVGHIAEKLDKLGRLLGLTTIRIS